MANNRNGKIDFLRMIFCLLVVFFHMYCDIPALIPEKDATLSFFTRGNIAVEFFFIVSGYLLASSVFNRLKNQLPIGKDSVLFMYKKVTGILPYHLVVFALTYVVTVLCRRSGAIKAIKTLVDALPNLFLIQESGIKSANLISVEWYISAMLLAMAIIYPLCKKNYDVFSRVVAPIFGVLAVGAMSRMYGGLAGTTVWCGVVTKMLIRAGSEICLGIFAFEVIRYLKKQSISRLWRILLTAVEAGGYLVTLVYSASTVNRSYEPYIMYFLLASIALSFSGITYGSGLFDNKLSYFLGRFSLPIYLSQTAARLIAKTFFSEQATLTRMAAILCLTLVIAVPVMLLGDLVKKKLPRLT